MNPTGVTLTSSSQTPKKHSTSVTRIITHPEILNTVGVGRSLIMYDFDLVN